MSGSKAFTLIELLVVVTLIAMLLAILTPAMDHAIYQAELAVCAANQHGMAGGVHQYAMTNRRLYPPRKDISNGTNWKPHQVNSGAVGGVTAPGQAPTYSDGDLRYYTAGYFPTKMFVDPLCERVDFSAPNASGYWSSYNAWFGFTYKGNPGLLRVGDRLMWGGRAFDLLVTDRDAIDEFTPEVENSHPDHEGVLIRLGLQDENFDAPGLMTVAGKAATTTFSIWYTVTRFDRSPVEMNYALTDESVDRLNDILWEKDERVVPVPQQYDVSGTWNTDGGFLNSPIYINLPRR